MDEGSDSGEKVSRVDALSKAEAVELAMLGIATQLSDEEVDAFALNAAYLVRGIMYLQDVEWAAIADIALMDKQRRIRGEMNELRDRIHQLSRWCAQYIEREMADELDTPTA